MPRPWQARADAVAAVPVDAAGIDLGEQRARRILSPLRTGSVYWNCCDRVSPRLPWSGHGDSGVGLTLSTLGIQTFTRPRAWHLRQP